MRYLKTFTASGAIGHRRLVKATATDGVVAQASAVTDKIIGVVDHPGGAANEQPVNVVLFGPAVVELGGTVTPFAQLTTDSLGRAVAAAPEAGVNNAVVGTADVAGVLGNTVYALIIPRTLQG